jgi:alpha-tubulin suppressor-like RCC1 family protein
VRRSGSLPFRRTTRLVALAFSAGAAVVAFACASEERIGTSSEERSPGPRIDAQVDTSPPLPVDAGRPEPAIRLVGGGDGFCAVTTASGLTRCWGANEFGQSGNGTSSDEAGAPSMVTGLSARELDPGPDHACAIDMRAGVTCWGRNLHGQLGHPSAVEIDAGPAVACAFDTPCSRVPVPAAGIAAASGISSGWSFSCARVDGTVACWGDNLGGATGRTTNDGEPSTPNRIAIADVDSHVSGGAFSCARKRDGTVWCWGKSNLGQIGKALDAGVDAAPFDLDDHPVPRQVAGLANARGIAASAFHACAIGADEAVSCWGSNGGLTFGEPGGQLGHDPTSDSLCDGTWKCNHLPIQVVGLAGVRELSLGTVHSCAVRTDDTVWCWGRNEEGRLGHDPASDERDGGPQAVFVPRKVEALTNVAHIAAAAGATCAVTWDSKVLCWGDNRRGQLAGSTDAGSTFVPTPLAL